TSGGRHRGVHGRRVDHAPPAPLGSRRVGVTRLPQGGPMSEVMKVVVRAVDGKVLNGTTQDFFPNRASFHLIPSGGGPSVEVRARQLKAVFFVKDFAGDPGRKDVPGFIAGPAETGQGKKIAVRFRDGELMCGYSLSYLPDREGFFLFPSDT